MIKIYTETDEKIVNVKFVEKDGLIEVIAVNPNGDRLGLLFTLSQEGIGLSRFGHNLSVVGFQHKDGRLKTFDV